jgi:hypothetical protein
MSQKEQPREIAREVAAQRVGELQRWLDKLRQALDTGSLYEAEADYQVIAVLATTTAEQILRVLRESGELREASGRGADQVEAQRRIHVNPFEHQRED